MININFFIDFKGNFWMKLSLLFFSILKICNSNYSIYYTMFVKGISSLEVGGTTLFDLLHCWTCHKSLFLLVHHLRLSQRRDDPVVEWLNFFVVITLYQQLPIGSTYKVYFVHFQHIRRVKTCNLSHKFQPNHGCIDPRPLAVASLSIIIAIQLIHTYNTRLWK